MKPMRAIVQSKYGSLDDLMVRDVERPAIGPDEVLVRVRAASVHPDVWHVVVGRPFVLRLLGAGLFKPNNPIPGTDMAGTVEAVGSKVTRFRPGDPVFGETIVKHQWTNGGAFSEYVCAREDWLARKPDNVTFEQAAAVPTAGFIALQNLRGAGHTWHGHRVLINGAGGGVGAIALQVARACGAQVTAVDSPKKLNMLRALGADRVIDYTQADFTRGDVRYDVIFDVPGNHSLAACRRVLEPGGNYVLIGHEKFGVSGGRFLGLLPRFLKLVFLSLFVRQLRRPGISTPTRGETMEMLRALLEAGKITPIIDRTYPLSQTRDALRRLVEDEPRGKVIIAPTED
jgi:NADPH:quinone reductase-like Zn-dependent oxidoreductase